MSEDQSSSGRGSLSHSELRLRQITDTIPAHIGYFDCDWVFRYGNRRYAQWFGTTSEGMKDRPILSVIGPHVFAHLIVITLFCLFPQLVLWLPQTMR